MENITSLTAVLSVIGVLVIYYVLFGRRFYRKHNL